MSSMGQRLHYLEIDSGRSSHWLYVLHGIYGAGRNWASVARSLIAKRPEWGAMLVDLRLHGHSQGFEPPHTLHACAHDVYELSKAVGVENVVVVDPTKDRDGFRQLLADSLASDALSVIIVRRPCVLVVKKIRQYELSRQEGGADGQ